MPKTYVKHAGAWKQVQRMWVKNAGAWKDVATGVITSGGIGKQFYPDTFSTVTYSVAGTYNYTVPAGVTSLVVTTVGAGGGGQAGNGNYSGAGGGGAGGGAGSTVTQTISVAPGTVIPVVVGSGGVGGVANASGGTSPNGQAGGDGGASYLTGFSSTNANGGAAGNKAAGTGNYPAGNPNGNWAGDGGSWWYGYVGASSSISSGGSAGGIYTDGGVGGLGSGGGGGSASNYNPNDYSSNGGNGGSGFVSIKTVGSVVFGDTTVNQSTGTRSGSAYSWTVPLGVYSVTINAAGGGGPGYAYHDGGYCQHAWAGGAGGGLADLVLAVQPGDVISGVYGDAGGKGYYNGGTGGPGSATTIYKNGSPVAVCGAGSQSSSGSTTIYMGSGTATTGSNRSGELSGCDGGYPPGDHYDPWSWVLGGSYTQSALGYVAREAPSALGSNYQRAGMPQVCGWVSITW